MQNTDAHTRDTRERNTADHRQAQQQQQQQRQQGNIEHVTTALVENTATPAVATAARGTTATTAAVTRTTTTPAAVAVSGTWSIEQLPHATHTSALTLLYTATPPHNEQVLLTRQHSDDMGGAAAVAAAAAATATATTRAGAAAATTTSRHGSVERNARDSVATSPRHRLERAAEQRPSLRVRSSPDASLSLSSSIRERSRAAESAVEAMLLESHEALPLPPPPSP